MNFNFFFHIRRLDDVRPPVVAMPKCTKCPRHYIVTRIDQKLCERCTDEVNGLGEPVEIGAKRAGKKSTGKSTGKGLGAQGRVIKMASRQESGLHPLEVKRDKKEGR